MLLVLILLTLKFLWIVQTENWSCIRSGHNDVEHTTNCRPLLSTIALCDASGTLQNFLANSPVNVHHLSTTAATDILEAYGVAISDNVRTRIGASKEFALMADESTNCSDLEMTFLKEFVKIRK